MHRPLLLAVLLALPAALLAQPTAPTARQLAEIRAAQSGVRSLATTPTLTVNPASREEMRQFYRAIYNASENVRSGWTGSQTTGVAGDTSVAFKEAVRLRINFFRALAGIPAGVTFNSTFSTKAQQAALMMSANGSLSHYPPTSWTFYTAAGAEAAGNSNLYLGDHGPGSVTGYIADPGANNAAAGHRRWLLYPQTQQMGTGDVDASDSFAAANAIWVLDSLFGSTRPSTRHAYVAWPAPGYMPASLIFPRWSFAYPDANFGNATVTMTRDGASVPVRLETVETGVGDNTLVWVYNDLDIASSTTPTVTTDSTFRVTVANVVINGTAQSFTYDVIAFDPERAGPDTQPATVTGSTAIGVGIATTYTVAAPSFGSGYQWRTVAFDNVLPVYDAESGLDGLVATTTGSYGGRSTGTVAAGSASYQLATPTAVDQFLTAPDTFYFASGPAELSLRSRLGFATTGQTARVQASIDDGVSWSDLYTQAGTGGGGETGFTTRTVPLASLAGIPFRIRFSYTQTPGTSFFPQTDPGVGWFFDNVTFTGVQHVAQLGSATTGSGTTFAYTASAAGSAGLQARGVLFDTYPLEWGPVTVVTAVSAPAFATQPSNQVVEAGGSVSLSATTATATTFRWQLNGADVSGATNATLTLNNLQPAAAGIYTAIATASGVSTTSNAAIVGVSTTAKVIGAGSEVSPNVLHPNGNTFDQVLLTGVAEAITADHAFNQITRTSYIDLDDDIVQVEFSGPGTLSLVLADSSGPAAPLNYNQSSITYMKGHAGIVITGATEHTNVSVFTVGRATAVNQALFKPEVDYDGIADIAFIAIASANGKFGGVRTSNAHYFAEQGVTGIYAPDVAFQGPLFIGDLSAFDTATPKIIVGSVSDARITGGDLLQPNGQAVEVSGLTKLTFTPGGDSHGNALTAKTNQAVLRNTSGTDVTAQIVVNP